MENYPHVIFSFLHQQHFRQRAFDLLCSSQRSKHKTHSLLPRLSLFLLFFPLLSFSHLASLAETVIFLQLEQDFPYRQTVNDSLCLSLYLSVSVSLSLSLSLSLSISLSFFLLIYAFHIYFIIHTFVLALIISCATLNSWTCSCK